MGLLLHPALPLSAQDLVLVVLAVVAAYTDVTERKIRDRVTVPAMVCGLALGFAAGGVAGLKEAGLGLLVAFALMVVPCELGGIGGGDAKLVIAFGALEGVRFAVAAVLLGWLFGGLHALVRLLRTSGGLHGLVVRAAAGTLLQGTIADRSRAENLPYGVSLSAGALAALVGRATGWLPWM